MFRLGYVTDPEPGHERMRGWLSIPYLGYTSDGEEQAWSLRFRCLPELNHPGYRCKDVGHGKYMGLPHEPCRMFNVRAIKDAVDEIHLTEGELDAVVLAQAGYPAVGMPGANQWSYRHARMLAGFNRVYIWGDPDEAGATMVGNVLAAMRTAAPVRLTEGDVTDTFLAGGYDALDEAVRTVQWG